MANTSNNQYLSLDECRQLAEDRGFSYYAGQNVIRRNGRLLNWCAASNSLSEITRYGQSNGCRSENRLIRDGDPSIQHGGPWANAVYSIEPDSNFF